MNANAIDSDRDRFGFGENWSRFAAELPPARIETAKASLVEMLERDDLEGATFLDVGSGSGLFSLSAALIGAQCVHSLDYDPDSVATTASLHARYAPDADWHVEQASALDAEHMESLGEWDIVYSWGVLHHTGDMWTAMTNTCARVAPNGRLFISIYNDQGAASRIWTTIKRTYNRLPRALRTPYAVAVMAPSELSTLLRKTLRGRPQEYFREWRSRGEYDRGMSRWHDLIDWVGGYPFEVATPEEIIDFCRERGFTLRRLRTVGGGYGCNEFVFERTAE
jgi:2-polyprenyl-6-hydroxyphenyl methylase/3-demethylubiquinone-9 3-methyltransferase